MAGPAPGPTARVQSALAAAGMATDVVEMPTSIHTAKQAAAAIGCDVAQIVKSLVFRGEDSGRAVLVLASGPTRVDEERIAALLGEAVAFPDADFVRQATGYAIGGVPPLGHATSMRTLIDEGLLLHDEIWAAAGTPRTVFRLTPADLRRITGGEIIAVQ